MVFITVKRVKIVTRGDLKRRAPIRQKAGRGLRIHNVAADFSDRANSWVNKGHLSKNGGSLGGQTLIEKLLVEPAQGNDGACTS